MQGPGIISMASKIPFANYTQMTKARKNLILKTLDSILADLFIMFHNPESLIYTPLKTLHSG